MHITFTPSSLLTILSLLSSATAVVVCSGYDEYTGGCQQPCTNIDISLDQQYNVPGTNCIYNSDQDYGFDLLICSGEDLQGSCSYLSQTRRTDITGDFNWETPDTNSIKRTGN